ncbi:hypothetical protein [Myroides marinus]|uniref:hypothetical protein n=1 Tax=Myroides TaxID=76831 RepID=UPI0025782AF8|nr:hypothetical protein [Myroides marinus]MDM1378174.1 hypothetical protein [Myroides marinus]MDM1385440.1 hypothetical protein [Myroides marinus]MDM1392653.1 hypothetical protein [Myroides marinus]
MSGNKDINFIKEHFISGGLYVKIDINEFDLFNYLSFFFDNDVISQIEAPLLNYSNGNFGKISTIQTLNMYCPKCGEKTTFESENEEEISPHIWEFINSCKDTRFGSALYVGEENYIKSLLDKIFNNLTNLSTITRKFVCVHSKTEPIKHFFSVSYKFENNKIIKVGQYPSINDLTGLDLKKYKTINNDVYLELNKANGLFSHGVGIGSYTYLRRIIEKYIVNEKYTNYLKSTGKTSEESEALTKNTYFKDKVTTLKDELSDLLHGNDKIYGFLSKGIHGLSEDECLEVFPILFDSICIILDEEIERIEKEAKKKELASKLNKLK